MVGIGYLRNKYNLESYLMKGPKDISSFSVKLDSIWQRPLRNANCKISLTPST